MPRREEGSHAKTQRRAYTMIRKPYSVSAEPASRSQTVYHGLRIRDYGLRITDYGSRITGVFASWREILLRVLACGPCFSYACVTGSLALPCGGMLVHPGPDHR